MNSFKISPLNKSQISFCSKNSPVVPFVYDAGEEKVLIKELPRSQTSDYTRFAFEQNIAESSDWKEYFSQKTPEETDYFLSQWENKHYYAMLHPDGNNTALVGLNRDGKIVAGLSLKALDPHPIVNNFRNPQVGYLSCCQVDKSYRQKGLAQKMLEAVMGSANGYFTDIYLESQRKAHSLYQRLGFLDLDMNNPSVKNLYLTLKEVVLDDFILMSKPLDNVNSCLKKFVRSIK